MASATAVLMIDLQIGLLEGAYRSESVVSRGAALVSRAREGEVPVIYVQHDHQSYEPLRRGAPTWEIHPDLAPCASDHLFSKAGSDAFFETPLTELLHDLDIERIVIMGLQTEYCVDTTCRRALSQGFDVVLAGDAHTTADGVLTAQEIIRHHNFLLANVAHPKRRLTVERSNLIDLEFSRAP